MNGIGIFHGQQNNDNQLTKDDLKIGEKYQLQRQFYKQKSKQLSKKLRPYVALLFVSNIGFIILSLMYAYNSYALDSYNQNLYCINLSRNWFTLTNWLQIDAYCRIGLIGSYIICFVFSNQSFKVGKGITTVVNTLFILYILFTLSWAIFGCVFFFGYLYFHIPNTLPNCTSDLELYMFLNLIWTYIFVVPYGFIYNCIRKILLDS